MGQPPYIPPRTPLQSPGCGRDTRKKATHLRRPRIKAWKRLRLLLSGARRLTWLYRVPRERVLEPEDTGRRQPDPSPALCPVPHSPPSPGFTDASTTLQGLLRRCPVMRSFRKGFSPSATRAWRAGQRVVSTRCPTSGLRRLSPNWAWRRRNGHGSRDTSSLLNVWPLSSRGINYWSSELEMVVPFPAPFLPTSGQQNRVRVSTP